MPSSAPSPSGGSSGAATPQRGEVLWVPSDQRRAAARITDFENRVRAEYQISGEGYLGLWRWSVDRPEEFWSSLLDYFAVSCQGDRTPAITGAMPQARWFPGLELNYAENVLSAIADQEAMVAFDETGATRSIRGDELRGQVATVAGALQSLGVVAGDRVAGYLPNVPEAIVAMLAATSLGAVWSCCAPDFGAGATLDRLAQINPKVLIAVDGYRFGGRVFDRTSVVDEIRTGIASLQATVAVPRIGDGNGLGDLTWAELLATGRPAEPVRLPFSHPLWVVYTSGTTGPPKAIVQGHGGILLEHLKALSLHYDLGLGSRFFQHTSTGWVMWNLLVSALATGSTIICYDGAPNFPDAEILWKITADLDVSDLAVGAVFLVDQMRRGAHPGRSFDLTALRSLGSTGAALPDETYRWVFEAVKRDLYLRSNSGGTDVCSGLLGAVPTLPVRSGELQQRPLGVAASVYDNDGNDVSNIEGELVVTAPMPSMPLYFWNDPDGRRYHDAYFDRYPNVWRHGDWACIYDDGASVVLGRSDATLNRGGVRIGTAEIYRVLEDLPELADSVVVDISGRTGDRGLVLFGVSEPGADRGALEAEIRQQLRLRASPRHVPDIVVWCEGLPRTVNGKRLEVPIKRILLGTPPDQAIDPGTIRNPEWLAALPALLAAARTANRADAPGAGP
jgi:acetoacetyl-CoA synthetase